jgi:hypothetical protein
MIKNFVYQKNKKNDTQNLGCPLKSWAAIIPFLGIMEVQSLKSWDAILQKTGTEPLTKNRKVW